MGTMGKWARWTEDSHITIHSDRKWCFSPCVASYRLLYHSQINTLSFWLYLYQHLSKDTFVVASGNKTHTFKKKTFETIFSVFGALASQASKSEPTRRDQDRPQKLKNCAVYATTTPSEQNNRSQVPIFQKFPKLFTP